MSHFSMIVVLDEKPTEDVLEGVLMPWHEFECTGFDNQYVQDVDKTEEARAEYESGTQARYRAPDGSLHDPYEDRFYREPKPEEKDTVGMGTGCGDGLSWHSKDWGDGCGYRAKVHFVPKGWEEIRVPTSEVEKFEEWASGYYGGPVIREGGQDVVGGDETKYGYVLVKQDGTVQVIDRTNPNAKWDWYQVGGRWSGLLRSKHGGERGGPGLMGAQYDTKGVDICRRGDLDIEAMRLARVEQREQMFVKALDRFKKTDFFIPGTTAEDLKKYAALYSMSIAGARAAWEAEGQQGAFHQFIDNSTDSNAAMIRNLRDRFKYLLAWELELPEGTADADEWIKNAPALSAWGVVKDGQWYEKGSMGWWGMSSGNKPEGQWEEELHKLILDLPEDKWLAVVDCHI